MLPGTIISSPQFHGLVDFDAELPDADPFVVALAVKTRDLTGFFGTAPAVVAVDSQEMGTSLESVCEDAGYQIRFLTPHQMLLEIGLDVPNPNRRGLADLYGIWMGMRSTEEDVQDAKIKFRGTRFDLRTGTLMQSFGICLETLCCLTARDGS